VTTGFDRFTDRAVVAMRVDGELQDLAREVPEGATVEPVTIDSPGGCSILHHPVARARAVRPRGFESRLHVDHVPTLGGRRSGSALP